MHLEQDLNSVVLILWTRFIHINNPCIKCLMEQAMYTNMFRLCAHFGAELRPNEFEWSLFYGLLSTEFVNENDEVKAILLDYCLEQMESDMMWGEEWKQCVEILTIDQYIETTVVSVIFPDHNDLC